MIALSLTYSKKTQRERTKLSNPPSLTPEPETVINFFSRPRLKRRFLVESISESSFGDSSYN